MLLGRGGREERLMPESLLSEPLMLPLTAEVGRAVGTWFLLSLRTRPSAMRTTRSAQGRDPPSA